MGVITEEENRLAHTDPKGFLEEQIKLNIFSGTVSEGGTFSGTVNLNQLYYSIREYISAKVIVSLAEMKAKNEELEQLISEKPKCDTMVDPTFQRMWEACNTLVEKAQFKFIFDHIGKLETKLQEVAAIAAEQTQKVLDSNTELHKAEQQVKDLSKVVEILVQKEFNDCFLHLCSSQNECQTFGCKIKKMIKDKEKEV